MVLFGPEEGDQGEHGKEDGEADLIHDVGSARVDMRDREAKPRHAQHTEHQDQYTKHALH